MNENKETYNKNSKNNEEENDDNDDGSHVFEKLKNMFK